jgi:ADP-ribosylation factor GTPase-activating protein 2/3
VNADDAASEPRKSSIGARKIAPKKAAVQLLSLSSVNELLISITLQFGAKKGGMGAQRVKANFTEIEQKAADFDKEREENAKFSIAPEPAQQAPDVNKLSARLMVQDIDDQRRKQELKLKSQDPKKAEVVDRLGMGGLGRGFVLSEQYSHGGVKLLVF